jgi:predicted hotdog family 3-hydroxylacyl-ACP dehydratase
MNHEAQGSRRIEPLVCTFLLSDSEPLCIIARRGKRLLRHGRAGRGAPAAAETVEPIVEHEARLENGLESRLVVPEDLAFLAGHFDGFPVVAGVVQVHWILRAAASWLGRPLHPRTFEGLKFKDVLRPGQRFRMSLETGPARSWLRFRLGGGERVFCTGRCRFGPAETAAGAGAGISLTPDGTFPAVADLVPQSGRMLLLDRVLAHDAERTVCLVKVDASDLFRDRDGGVPAWVGLEYMAQCIAAHGGLRERQRGGIVKPGLFLGTRRLELWTAGFAPGEVLRASARHVRGKGRFLTFACALRREEDAGVLAEGELNVYILDEPKAMGDQAIS